MAEDKSILVSEVQSIIQRFEKQRNYLAEVWQDKVHERFDKDALEPFCKHINSYLSGEGLESCGLEDILKRMSQHLSDMSSLTGNL